MLYTLRLLIGAQKLSSCSLDNEKLLIGFCLQALEMSRHRLYVRGDITHREQDWLHKLETCLSDHLHSCAVDDAEDAVIMYVDAINSVGIKFYNGAYPLVLIDALCYLCVKSDRLKASHGRHLVQICADMLLGLKSCLSKLSFTVDFLEGLLTLAYSAC